MNGRLFLRLAAMTAIALALSSCATTAPPHLSDIWRDTSHVSAPLKDLLVIGVKKDQRLRQEWEDGFAAALWGHGTVVTPSYRVFGEKLPDTSAIHTIAAEQRFDGVVMIGNAYVETRKGTSPGYNVNSTDYTGEPWSGWYNTYFGREYYPSYPMEGDVVKDEIKVWSMRGVERMIWMGQGEAPPGVPREEFRNKIIQLVVADLAERKFIY